MSVADKKLIRPLQGISYLEKYPIKWNMDMKMQLVFSAEKLRLYIENKI